MRYNYNKAEFCGDRQWLLNGDFSCNKRVLYLIKTYDDLSIPEAKKSLLDQNCTCVGDGVGSGADHRSAAIASSAVAVARASTIPAVKEDVQTYDYDYSNTSTATKKVVVVLSLALLVMTFGFRKRRGLVTRAGARARASRARRVPFAVIIAVLFTARNIFYALSGQYMDTYIKYLQPYEVQNNCIKEVEQHLQQVEHTLQAIHIRYYMYDDPDITLTGETRAAFELIDRNGRKDRYKHEEENDRQMILALEKSSLRTLNANEAQLFIPPIPMSSILISKSSDFKTPMDALLNHPIFQRNLGNNHLLISTCFALHRYHYRAYTQLKDYYHLIYNMTIVQSWDPVAVHNDLFHSSEKSSNWGDYHSTLVKEEPTSLSRRSISVGLGSNNHDFPLNHATMEKFNSSTNFIFYHSRTEPSFNNSTIYRHAPITNITLDNNFPKSSIGWGLKPDEWLEEFSRSQFCLMIRGDSPHSHALWRSIRVGCIPVIISKHLPVYAPIFKSTLNMSDYAVILDEEELLRNATKALLTLREMTIQQVEIKLLHLAFAQRVLFTDHPESLFVPALLKEAIAAEEVLEKKKIMRMELRTKKVKVSTKNDECTKHRHRACRSKSNCIWHSKNLQCISKSSS